MIVRIAVAAIMGTLCAGVGFVVGQMVGGHHAVFIPAFFAAGFVASMIAAD
jgi:hypothetical protein